MITWFAIAQMAVAVLAACVTLTVFFRRSAPNDYVLGSTLLVGVLLVVQIIVGIVAPFAGNHCAGDPLEFWMYLFVAVALPFGGGFWALIDRRRSANLVLVVIQLAVAVMLYRMLVIWG